MYPVECQCLGIHSHKTRKNASPSWRWPGNIRDRSITFIYTNNAIIDRSFSHEDIAGQISSKLVRVDRESNRRRTYHPISTRVTKKKEGVNTISASSVTSVSVTSSTFGYVIWFLGSPSISELNFFVPESSSFPLLNRLVPSSMEMIWRSRFGERKIWGGARDSQEGILWFEIILHRQSFLCEASDNLNFAISGWEGESACAFQKSFHRIVFTFFLSVRRK